MNRIQGHLKRVSLHQYDSLKGLSLLKGHLIGDLLLAPALLLQGVADNIGRLLEARVEVEGHICTRLHAAPALEIHLESGERNP